MIKITGLSHLFKWDNLHNWCLTKYSFAPLYVDNYKYLGVWLDDKLSFQTHIKHLPSKIKLASYIATKHLSLMLLNIPS